MHSRRAQTPLIVLSKSALWSALLIIIGWSDDRVVRADAIARMKADKLRAVQEAVEELQAQRQPVTVPTGYDDVRAVIHVHSHWSHDSRGQLDEILPAAKKCGIRVIMFTEHPAPHYDYFRDGHQGVQDGILCIPGAETGGFLAFPRRSMQSETSDGPQAFSSSITDGGGLTFTSHVEERRTWDIAGMTGTEIYNIHADLFDEKPLMARIRNPLGLLALVSSLEKHPQVLFAAIQDYPADYLKYWDDLCQKRRLTAVAANDAHHNQHIRATVTDEGKVRVLDGLGEEVALLDPEKLGILKGLVENKQTGDTVLDVDLDPYERSFRHVSTHLLMHNVAQDDVWDALRAGRTYVAFDWMCDPTGFAFQVEGGGGPHQLGAEVAFAAGLKFRVAAPLPGKVRLMRQGEEAAVAEGADVTFELDQPGVYRAEVWLQVADESRPWILSGPIYVRGAETGEES